MDAYFIEWLNMLGRWIHFITGIASMQPDRLRGHCRNDLSKKPFDRRS